MKKRKPLYNLLVLKGYKLPKDLLMYTNIYGTIKQDIIDYIEKNYPEDITAIKETMAIYSDEQFRNTCFRLFNNGHILKN